MCFKTVTEFGDIIYHNPVENLLVFQPYVMVLAPSFNASSMTVGKGLPLRECVLVGVHKSGGVRI